MKHLRLVLTVLVVAAALFGLSRSENADATSYHAEGLYRIKDFAMIEKDGVFHVYAIHECPTWSTPATCDPTRRGFMHLTSTDLTNWTEVGFILPPDSRTWRSYDVWAPTVVEKDGTYSMIYTVVEKQASNGMRVQRISLATSTDLYNWTDTQTTPVFDCGQFPWAYWNLNSTDGIGGECRDPYVTWDVAGQQWVMYVSARIATFTPPLGGLPHPMIVGVATSPDLIHWTDAGHLDNTAGWITESSHVFQHNGLWYLPWTSNTGIRYSSSTSMFGPFTDKGLIPFVSPYAFASEELTVNGREYFGFITSGVDTMDIKELGWASGNMYPWEVQYGTAKVRVWSDDSKNGVVDQIEPNVDGMTVRIFRDDGNGSFNPETGDSLYVTSTTGDDPTTGSIEHGIAVALTLRPGSYWLDLDPAAFVTNGRLQGYTPPQPVFVTVSAFGTVTVALPVTLGGLSAASTNIDRTGDTAEYAGYIGTMNDLAEHRTGTVQLASASAVDCLQMNNLSALTIDQGGTVRWTLSNDGGITWVYWNGEVWVPSTGTSATTNTLAELRSNLSSFVGGTIAWKALIDAPVGSQPLVGPVAVSCNTAPSKPQTEAPLYGSTVPSLTPTFSFQSVDVDGDALVYEIQIDTTLNFSSSNLRVVRYGLSDAGWGSADQQAKQLFASAAVATYTPPEFLPNGMIYWRVRAIDLLGSGSFSPYSNVQAFLAPSALTLTAPVITPLTNHSVKMQWTSSNPGDANGWLANDYDIDLYQDEATTSHLFTVDGLIPGATYEYIVWTNDIYGQRTESNRLTFTMPIDTVTAVTNIQVTPTAFGATISWQTNEPTTGKVLYGLYSSYGFSKSDTSTATTHTVTITGLKSLKTYHFAVQSTGSTTITSPDATFTTSSVAGDTSDLRVGRPISRTGL